MAEINDYTNRVLSSRAYLQEQDYDDFVDSFSHEMKTNFSEDCFYVFGSYGQKNADFIPGISDVDGGIILDSGVFTNKERYKELAQAFARSIGNRSFKVQYNVFDLETARDGRFLSYGADYVNYVTQFSRHVSGPDFRGEYNGFDYKAEKLKNAAFNMTGPSGLRNDLFMLPYYYYMKSPSDFQEKCVSFLSTVLSFPRNLAWLMSEGDTSVLHPKKNAYDFVMHTLDDVDVSYFDVLAARMRDVPRLYASFDHVNAAFFQLAEGLTVVETLVDSYLKHFPEIFSFEVASI